MKIVKQKCRGVEVSVCGNAGVVKISFKPAVLHSGIVAHPNAARKLAARIMQAVNEAENSPEAQQDEH